MAENKTSSWSNADRRTGLRRLSMARYVDSDDTKLVHSVEYEVRDDGILFLWRHHPNL